jgi:hypothetical protein
MRTNDDTRERLRSIEHELIEIEIAALEFCRVRSL